MNLSKKIALSVAVGFFSNFAFAQTLQEGVANADSHKYAKAKEVFTQMIAKSPTAENYFYLGNSYLTQFEPNFDVAQENFNKGLAAETRIYRHNQHHVEIGENVFDGRNRRGGI